MKTKENNLRKRQQENMLMKRITVLFALIMVCTSLNGQGLWSQPKINHSQSLLAINVAVATEINSNSVAGNISEYLVEETEAPMEVENWMTNESYFNCYIDFLEVEHEEKLEIENWMVDEEFFVKSYMLIDKEEVLEIENWMVDESYWK